MELRHLRCFLAVAEELHFARAAEKLHIEQSPLSRTIKELEEELGVVLFARTTRSTRLTRAGKLFSDHVPRIFTSLQQARDSVKAAANGFHSQLRIALSDGMTPSRLPALVALCRQEEPEVEIRFFEVPLSQQIKGLHGDLYDVGFARADEIGDGLIAEPVWSDPLMVAVPARHPLLAHKRIPLEELLRYPLVLCGPQACEGHARQVDRVLRRVDMEPLVAERVASCELMMALVSAGSCASTLLWIPIAVGLMVQGQQTMDGQLAVAAAVSAALHIAYSLTLQAGYDRADLGVVYPIARGTGPVLTMLFAILVLGERLNIVALFGALLVVSGVLVVAGNPLRSGSRRPLQGML